MTGRFLPSGSFVITALLVAPAASAQDRTTEIDKIFRWAKPGTPGAVVAVSHRGKLVVNRAYGSADLERDVPVGPNTVFDIGSVRKQFVAAAVGKITVMQAMKSIWPFYAAGIVVLGLVTYIPALSLWLPSLFRG